MSAFIFCILISFGCFYLYQKQKKKRISDSKKREEEIVTETTNKVIEQVINNLEVKLNEQINYNDSFSSLNENAEQIKEIVPVVKISEEEYLINQGSIFELHLQHCTKELAEKIKELLEIDIWDQKKSQEIVAIFAEHNLIVKEVEEYKNKYKKSYFDTINQLKETSKEWQEAGELDKEDILKDFRLTAISNLYEKADCDLVTLFEKVPSDITVDDQLIKDYGWENINIYLKYADNLDKVRVIPSDNYNRRVFEKLVELGICERGSSIKKEDILSTLTLKELNDLDKGSQSNFKRKNVAIEHLLQLPNIDEIIGSKISLRELFKLKPLPEKYSSLNLKEISDGWGYTYEVVKLLVDTYNSAKYTEQLLHNRFITEYTVQNWDRTDSICKHAKELMDCKYTKDNHPNLPCHIGCNCRLQPNIN